MRWMFPYKLVEKDSKIILYGAGNVGKDFYLQIYYSGYCELLAWVDKSFDYYETAYPYAKIESILDYEFDFIVIAIQGEETATEVRNYLLHIGVDQDKIIWSHSYGVGYHIFPYNKTRYLKDWDFYIKLIDASMNTESIFAGEYFYQSYPELGIDGAHKTGERIKTFQLDRFLKPDDRILDIGCNCGFFDLQISDMVNHVTGVDVSEGFIHTANMVREYLGIHNVNFEVKNVFTEGHSGSYNAVFCIAVHRWIFAGGLDEQVFVDKVNELIQPDGYLFFASHEVRSELNRYRRICKRFEDAGMDICLHDVYSSWGLREITVFRKRS